MIVGIDLGTTFSAIAYVNDLGKAQILPNREGEQVTPSVVLFQGDLPLVGSMAKRSAASSPEDCVQQVKRWMGDADWRFDARSGERLRAEEISARIIKRLVEDAELILGEGTVTGAVITVPAYFNDAQRRATMDAGKIAELNVLRVLNEPTAAALAYGVETENEGTFLVYDLGGGTFDVTVMRIKDGNFDVLATDGDRYLGGVDWDNKLMLFVNEKFQAEGGEDLSEDAAAEADLRERAELAKRSLSSVKKANVMVTFRGVSRAIPVTRDDFEELSAQLLSRTRDLTETVIADAGLTWDQVDRILLVGGSTRMPMVPAMMQELTGKPAERGIAVDEVVAMGAAIQGSLSGGQAPDSLVPYVGAGGAGPRTAVKMGESEIVISDVTSQALGTITLSSDTGRNENAIIIPRNTKIPAQLSREFYTLYEQQTRVQVEVTQGDDADPAFVTIVGEQTLSIPPYPKGAPVRITYSYDVDQIIHIEIVDLTSGQSMGTFEVVNDSNMDRGEVASARSRLVATEVG